MFSRYHRGQAFSSGGAWCAGSAAGSSASARCDGAVRGSSAAHGAGLRCLGPEAKAQEFERSRADQSRLADVERYSCCIRWIAAEPTLRPWWWTRLDGLVDHNLHVGPAEPRLVGPSSWLAGSIRLKPLGAYALPAIGWYNW